MTDKPIRIHLQWQDGRTLNRDWSAPDASSPPKVEHDDRMFVFTGDRTEGGLPIYQERDDA
ncbi:MAG: hypothetical protein QGG24_09415 [Vicinamibacterales bacterium]|jgi:hypothetical protein|nr:hypothetical protein [Vicinamibacterales bacterium]MDP7471500.1 hypothetical protein [Vicinamibacterales bacterium]MDP7673101.1 hypothetical protein [Vicinamibacterales bacterium]HJO37457.1 hypothetical protein [Vicinamibacterales bacterium]|tara:strand:+ start:288 stop:470 length:183 start_codon:yes stop_codon:yes gene_type:complete